MASSSNNKKSITTPASNTYDTTSTTHSLLSPSNQKAVIDILSKAEALSSAQVDKVNSLIDAHDPSVSRTFAVYESNKDLNQLISTLKGLQIPIYKLSVSIIIVELM